MATLTCFTAEAIAASYWNFILPSHPDCEIYLSGGGVHNRFLIARLKQALPGFRIRSIADLAANPDAKEAVAFGILGYLT